MRSLTVFNHVSLDGFIADADSDMSWAHRQDDEWREFASANASGGGELLFGRRTYELMASFWPTSQALESMPVVAERMNALPKVVFSRTLDDATWSNTRLVRDDLVDAVRRLKEEEGPNMVILGSGSIVSQLTEARLIDTYQIVLNPVALGSGRAMFGGLSTRVGLRLEDTRVFGNGNVVLWYRLAR